MEIRLDNLEPGCHYHIFNRGINGCKVFENDENCIFFLQKAEAYILHVADVYAYCLMPNHFHFILRIKDDINGNNFAKVPNFGKVETGLHAEKSIASKQIGKLISSYTQAFNKYHNRHGSLFERPFKRKRIETEDYLIKSIICVHRNVIDLNRSLNNYDFSSYKAIVSGKQTHVRKETVIEWFDDIENFKLMHQRDSDYEF
ncbi:hypothetical protein KSK37_04295 [Kaistella sp. DKR-2]|uniref:hypothetical protein n=1 Tax=Kaistella soli TaxID=2849654 RepID=UPI001C2716CA|nr:hypothetical protein [Kaistella soli]MBU8882300.1 hypothetical protein [Kaistella soli]